MIWGHILNTKDNLGPWHGAFPLEVPLLPPGFRRWFQGGLPCPKRKPSSFGWGGVE